MRGKTPLIMSYGTKGQDIMISARKVAYLIFRDPAPSHSRIYDSCGNIKCVNPAHLFIGTSKYFFESKIKKGEHCWLWLGGTTKGYGRFTIRKRGSFAAHRFAYELFRGKIPLGYQVLHHCDNPPCVRPDHLFLGTNLDNTRDKMMKNRHRCPKGSAHGCAKLTEAKVRQIRRLYEHQEGTMQSLADRFKISIGNIHGIIRRYRWKHV